MAINATGLFSTSTTTSPAAAYWKPVTPPAVGTAADAFQHLNPKARQMLEDFVNAGMAVTVHLPPF